MHQVLYPLHNMLHSINNTATDLRCTMLHSNTAPVKILAPLNTRSSRLKWVSAAEHHTAEQYPKPDRPKPPASLKENSIIKYTPGFLQDAKCLRSALKTERTGFSQVIVESNVTSNTAWSLDSTNCLWGDSGYSV